MAIHAEKFSYFIKAVTPIQNGLDKATLSKNTVIVVDTDNRTVVIEGQKYSIISSEMTGYPEIRFNVSGQNNKEFKILIDYDYNFFIIDFRNGYARKYKFYKSSVNWQ